MRKIRSTFRGDKSWGEMGRTGIGRDDDSGLDKPERKSEDTKADIQVAEASFDESTILKGDTATVTAILENRGDAAGMRTLRLNFNDGIVSAEPITIDGEAKCERSVSFEPKTIGNYDLKLYGETLDSLGVEPFEEKKGNATKESQASDGFFDATAGKRWLLMVAVIGTIILALYMIWWFWVDEEEKNRRKHSQLSAGSH